MIVSHLKLRNWRNFREVDVSLQRRQFIVGSNASGKSNLLDVFRFLRDIAAQAGGGLQKAIEDRGGMSKLRCLSARKQPNILIEITISDTADEVPLWKYAISMVRKREGTHEPVLRSEEVWRWRDDAWQKILERPDEQDRDDPERLKQTHLEQTNNNRDFRDIGAFLNKVTYLHIVPQMLRHADAFQSRILENDPFGQRLLITIASTPQKRRQQRLNRIERALKRAVPQLKNLRLERDKVDGQPHLTVSYEHWRAHDAIQNEAQLSDGTLRLIGFLWALLDGDSLLLLEEPELSLHSGIVATLAPLIYRTQSNTGRQVLISTHSETLLSDKGIDGSEILLLTPEKEGTAVTVASENADIKALLSEDFSPGEVVIPKTAPNEASQLALL